MKTNILMVYPKTDLDKKGNSVGLPLSLLHIAPMLDRKNFRFFIVDQRVNKNWKKRIEYLLKKHDFLCAGISTMTGSQIKWGLNAAKAIKNLSKNTKIIFGGVHPTIYPEQTIKHPLVDIAVLGEGESAFPRLINALKEKKPLDNIPGLCYMDKGKLVNTGAQNLLDLDDFPEPDYSLIKARNYFLNLYSTKKALSLVTGRGCPHRCAFCYNPVFNKSKWRSLSVKNMIARIKKLIDLGAQSIDIIDDNFFTKKSRVKEFCEAIKKEKIKARFVANCRADYVARFDEDFLKMVRDAGFREFYVGIESGSQRMLDYIKKDLTVEQVLLCNKKLKKCGIVPIYSFMAGFPNETKEDIMKTLHFMMRLLKENDTISLTSLKVYTPFPGSELFEECVKCGLKIPDTFEEWSQFTYNSSSYKWRSKKMNLLLKKISYITYFLDQKTMAHHLGKNNPLLWLMIKIYSKIAWLRCKHGFFHFTPEVFLMEKMRKFIG